MNVFTFAFAFLACSLHLSESWIVDPGPTVIATKGEVWPKPQGQEKYEEYFHLDKSQFKFSSTGKTCSLLEDATTRYYKLIEKLSSIAKKYERKIKNKKLQKGSLGGLSTLEINLINACTGSEYPSLNKEAEKYNLSIPSTSGGKAQLTADNIWGILRGLESFSQLLYINNGDVNIYLNATTINDFPRFGHRGILLDSSRHFQPLSIIYKLLDAMEYNKINVFHWHIVDDQSFPYESTAFPELSEQGSYHPTGAVYTRTDVKNVIEYARVRGVRVMVEFDMPGHTRSWGVAMPELLTGCFENGVPTNQYGPMDPSREFVYSFLNDFLTEAQQTFPEQYMHLGGDEVSYDCWETNPDLNSWMDSKGMSGDYKAVERYFMERVLAIVQPKGIVPVVWEESFVAGTKLTPETIVQVWYGGYPSLKKVVEAGQPALLSSCWYLDHLATGGDWKKYYDCDPHNFDGTNEQKNLVMGGEACMWAEVVDQNNVLSRIWPRASAVAEKLWSSYNADEYENVQKRLEEHSCRMNRRDIPAQPPNHAGFCLM
nr:beta-hexosaminidase subunit beta-like isoform X1 [Onthophagus taurus]